MTSELVLGGARSGKSRHAMQAAQASGMPVTLIVTADACDAEMQERIARHRADRPAHWQVIECGPELPEVLARESRDGTAVVIDCATLWLSRMVCDQPDVIEPRSEELCGAVRAARGALWMVSNETGCGVVPDHAMGRLFRDAQGRLNQRLAQACTHVTLVVAGLPLTLK